MIYIEKSKEKKNHFSWVFSCLGFLVTTLLSMARKTLTLQEKGSEGRERERKETCFISFQINSEKRKGVSENFA